MKFNNEKFSMMFFDFQCNELLLLFLTFSIRKEAITFINLPENCFH